MTAAAVLALGTGCSKDLKVLDKGCNELAVTVTEPALVLNEANYSADALSISWTTGNNARTGNRISYSINFEVPGQQGISMSLGTQVYSFKKDVQSTNDLAINALGLTPGVAATVKVSVVADVAEKPEYQQVASTEISITPYTPVTSTLYLIGDATPTGWSADSPSEMSREQPGLFTWTGKLKSTGTFKFITTKGKFVPSYNRKDGTVNELVYRASDDDPDVQFSIPEDGYYVVTADLLNMKVEIKASAGKKDRFEEVYFVGSFTGWSHKLMDKNPLEINLWHWNMVFNWNGGGEFKFGTVQGWDDMLFATEPNAPYTSTGVIFRNSEDTKWFLPEADCGKPYKIILNVTKDKEYMFMREFKPYPAIWMIGSATSAGWSLSNAVEMTKVDDYTFTWTGHLNEGELKFTCDKQGDWNGAWFMATTSNKAPEGTEEQILFIDKGDNDLAKMYYEVTIGGVDNKWKISQAGTYTITIDQLKERATIALQ